MKNNLDTKQQKAINILNSGGVVVLRTDTLYGIVARADDEMAVQKVYQIKGRTPSKSCIILLDSIQQSYGDLQKISDEISKYIDRPTSFLTESENAPRWLLRANNMLAYRLPNVEYLKQIIKATGPLIAPSANPEGLAPATSIQKAKQYFGDSVDYYLDGGEVPVGTPASRIIKVDNSGKLETIR